MNFAGAIAMVLYVGAYTDAEHPKGISEIELDETSGKLALGATYEVVNAVYFSYDRAGGLLYCDEKDGVGSFAVKADGTLERLDYRAVGALTCHVEWMPGAGRLAWAAYSAGKSGSVGVDGGRFGEPVVHEHAGKGTNLPRQGSAHPHCAVTTPDGKHYAVCDLGLDEVRITEVNDGKSEKPDGDAVVRCRTMPDGAGPRHIIYHPDGGLAFIIYELGDMIGAYRCERDGRLVELADLRYTTGERAGRKADPQKPVKENGTAAAIRFTPDMKRVVVSNRKEHSLAVFDFDPKTGEMKHVRTSVIAGDWPRDFIFVGETLAVAAMERSGEVHSLRYDPESGGFTVISTLGGMFRPVALMKK